MWGLFSSNRPYDPRKLTPTKKLENLVNYCEAYNFQAIVSADANVNYEALCSTKNNRRAEYLSE